MLLDIAVICAAWVYSRFLFSKHLKKHHRSKWKELVVSADDFKGPNLLSFDITGSMYDFRVKNTDDLGDQRLNQIRRRSVLLFRIGIIAWLALVLPFLAVGGLYILARHH